LHIPISKLDNNINFGTYRKSTVTGCITSEEFCHSYEHKTSVTRCSGWKIVWKQQTVTNVDKEEKQIVKHFLKTNRFN
jgi:hypothetical protein